MTTTATKPVVVIVPGAWHVPAHYAYLALKLNSIGYTVDCLELSSTNEQKDLPENPWTEDIAIIRNAITSHTEAGRNVAVLMHSFGGMAGSEAACGLGKKEGETTGAVVKLIYMTSFMLQEGQTLASLGTSDDWPKIAELDNPENPKALVPLDPKHFFYHDVSEQMTQRAIDNLGGFPLSHAMNSPTKVAWREIPTAYLVCEYDRALTAAGQRRLIDAVKAQGVEVEVTSLKASHSPFLSIPGETAKAIHEFLEKA